MSRGPVRVLIVDDTADLRLLIRLTLGLDDRTVVVGEAADGVEAIAEVTRLHPDVVLLDLAMPRMDGLEALPILRERSPESKVIVLSGFNADQMREDALASGAASYLVKGGIATKLVPRILELFPDLGGHAPAAPAEVLDDPVGQAEELLSMLAHEMRNPLTVLQGFSAVLQGDPASLNPAVVRTATSAIGRAVTHLTALVDALTDLHRIDVDALELQRSEVDVAVLVQEVVADMVSLTRDRVDLRLAGPLVASVDPLRIRQVVINLVANAAKFALPPTRIEVRGAGDGPWIKVSVVDAGPGIPRDQRDRLFGKFARLNRTVAGTGLGLYLSRSIVRAHGGDLVLEDTPQPGCVFTFTVPRPG